MNDMRHTKTVLLISLICNAFLIGIVVSYYMFRHVPEMRPRPPLGHGAFVRSVHKFQMAKNVISPDGRAIVDAILNAKRVDVRHKGQATKDLQREAERILTSHDFNAETLRSIHEKIDGENSKVENLVSVLIYEIATQLSDDDRVLFFQTALPPHNGHP